jgi:hypothetical protein
MDGACRAAGARALWASMRRFGPRQRHDHHMGSVPGKRAGVVDDRAVDEDLLRRLGRFEVEHGRVPVARRYRCGDGFPLGLRLRTCLAQGLERHHMLRQALGGDLWPIRTPVTFRNEALAHLWACVRERHSAWVPTSYVCEDGFKLGMWVHRRRCRRGILGSCRSTSLRRRRPTAATRRTSFVISRTRSLKALAGSSTSVTPRPAGRSIPRFRITRRRCWITVALSGTCVRSTAIGKPPRCSRSSPVVPRRSAGRSSRPAWDFANDPTSRHTSRS